MKNEVYEISFRCYYSDGTHTTHRQFLTLKDTPKWIEAYRFTHPEIKSISVKLWFEN